MIIKAVLWISLLISFLFQSCQTDTRDYFKISKIKYQILNKEKIIITYFLPNAKNNFRVKQKGLKDSMLVDLSLLFDINSDRLLNGDLRVSIKYFPRAIDIQEYEVNMDELVKNSILEIDRYDENLNHIEALGIDTFNIKTMKSWANGILKIEIDGSHFPEMHLLYKQTACKGSFSLKRINESVENANILIEYTDKRVKK
jgi:hypothetical protein